MTFDEGGMDVALILFMTGYFFSSMTRKNTFISAYRNLSKNLQMTCL